MNRARHFYYPLVVLCVQTCVCAAQDTCTSGELRTDSTPHSISFEWDLTGDINHDATCKVQYPERNVDIYGNEIFDVSDDGLEPDYGFANVRMWGNRIMNAKNYALSFQPMKCGPWYFVRNVCVGTGGIFKFRVQDRFALINNTFVKWGSIGDRMHHILSSYSRNNLYISADGKGPIWTAYDCKSWFPTSATVSSARLLTWGPTSWEETRRITGRGKNSRQ